MRLCRSKGAPDVLQLLDVIFLANNVDRLDPEPLGDADDLAAQRAAGRRLHQVASTRRLRADEQVIGEVNV